MTLGTSGMAGTYDPENKLSYVIAGADLSIRVVRTTLRMEYLARRQQFSTNNPDLFKYALAPVDGDFFVKHGGFVEIEQPMTTALDLVARVDGMLRIGNVSDAGPGGGNAASVTNPLPYRASVLRETLALAYAVGRNFRFKGSVELWDFNYPDSAGRETELSFHLGTVGSF
jgi:hypothetical protein